jgi:hypothetical protein
VRLNTNATLDSAFLLAKPLKQSGAQEMDSGTWYLNAQLLNAHLYQKLHTPMPLTLTAVE